MQDLNQSEDYAPRLIIRPELVCQTARLILAPSPIILDKSDTVITTAHRARCTYPSRLQTISTALVIAAAFSSGVIVAQDVSAEASYGSIDLAGFFSPDPYREEILAGGSVNARDVAGCSGYISDAPDLELGFSNPASQLGFFVTSDVDTTLVINDPSGDWHCNDDFDTAGGTNAGLNFSRPEAGVYDIWVGSYSEDDTFTSANLYITELGAPWNGVSSSDQSELDQFEDANYGDFDLTGNFEPDPFRRTIRAGGSVNANTVQNCSGYVSSAPDLQLNFSQPSTYDLSFFVESALDTTLVVNGPSGEWHCNDDFNGNSGTNPGVVFADPDEGIYDIWVGTYAVDDAFTEVELYITELGTPWEGTSGNSTETFPSSGGRQLISSGTGFVVSADGHILTNHHVIDGCAAQTFRIRGDVATDAVTLASNATTDLALLRADISATPAEFSGAQTLRLGDEVVVYGFPLLGDLSSQGNLTNGIVSALSGLNDDLSRLQMTAQIQPGNSGGPVMNRNGEIVGVVVETANDEFFRERRGTAVQNLNFAIRDSIARTFLDTNNVDYVLNTAESESRSVADIAEAAQQYTGIIKCYR